MKPLLKKELRALLPLVVLAAVIYVSDVAYLFLTSRPDELTWTGQRRNLVEGDGWDAAFLYVLLGLAAAYSVLPREHDEGTIHYLYALPVRRRSIFAAKAVAAWMATAAAALLDQSTGAFLAAWNPQTLGGEEFRLGLALQVLALESFFCGVVVAHGLLMSFLRRFGFLLYGVFALAVGLVLDHFPSLSILDPGNLLALRYEGRDLVVPWSGLALHGTVAAAALLLAWVLWTGAAEGFTRLYRRVRERVLGRLALGCATVALGVLVTVAVVLLPDSEIDDPGTVRFPSFLPVRAETLNYDFTYNAGARERARRLIAEADGVYYAVARALGAGEGPRVDADLTDPGAAHLGIAQGGVLRVALENLDDDGALRTLVHETVHVFQYELSDGKASDVNNSVRFFTEGSAEWVTAELLTGQAKTAAAERARRRAHRRLAATAWHLHDIRFEEMVDDRGFRERHDPLLAYTLGEVFTAALADTCGGQAPGDVFRAIGREDAPEDLAGFALWQDLAAAAGCDVESTVARFDERLREIAWAEREFIRALPRLGGGPVAVEDGTLVFKVAADRAVGEPAATYYLNVRRDASVGENEMRTYTSTWDPEDETVTFYLPGAWAEAPFEHQVGQDVEGSMWAFFEDWQTASP